MNTLKTTNFRKIYDDGTKKLLTNKFLDIDVSAANDAIKKYIRDNEDDCSYYTDQTKLAKANLQLKRQEHGFFCKVFNINSLYTSGTSLNKNPVRVDGNKRELDIKESIETQGYDLHDRYPVILMDSKHDTRDDFIDIVEKGKQYSVLTGNTRTQILKKLGFQNIIAIEVEPIDENNILATNSGIEWLIDTNSKQNSKPAGKLTEADIYGRVMNLIHSGSYEHPENSAINFSKIRKQAKTEEDIGRNHEIIKGYIFDTYTGYRSTSVLYSIVRNVMSNLKDDSVKSVPLTRDSIDVMLGMKEKNHDIDHVLENFETEKYSKEAEVSMVDGIKHVSTGQKIVSLCLDKDKFSNEWQQLETFMFDKEYEGKCLNIIGYIKKIEKTKKNKTLEDAFFDTAASRFKSYISRIKQFEKRMRPNEESMLGSPNSLIKFVGVVYSLQDLKEHNDVIYWKHNGDPEQGWFERPTKNKKENN